jgi:hypothetical protein
MSFIPQKLEARNASAAPGFIHITGSRSLKVFPKENEMRMPSSIATWCLILFFLLYGLQAFGLAIPAIILALLALGVAIFTLIGR